MQVGPTDLANQLDSTYSMQATTHMVSLQVGPTDFANQLDSTYSMQARDAGGMHASWAY